MRYEKAELLLRLALELQASRTGLTLQDMQERLDVGRRTAMRMRDALERLFPQLERVLTDERTHRWRLPPGTLDRLAQVDVADLAVLDAAADLLARENLSGEAGRLRSLRDRLRSVMRPEVARRVETDYETVKEGIAHTLRPGPRPKVPKDVQDQLTEAIQGFQVARMTYYSKSSGAERIYEVEPYGFLYGHRHYLIAIDRARDDKMRTFSLTSIRDVTVLDQMFVRKDSFSIRDFTSRSFGVFDEPPHRVIWRFSPRAAVSARDYIFHPTQVMTDGADGSLTVEFHAGGLLEMAWHLLSWGSDVEVIEPVELRDMIDGAQKRWRALP